MKNKVHRLFFGLELNAPWPSSWPKGRIISEKDRHMTLCFLGNTTSQKLSELKNPPLFLEEGSLGSCAVFDSCLELPENNPHVVAWHADWLDNAVYVLQKNIVNWLEEKQLQIEKKELLSHVSLCRSPFDIKEWKASFQKLPCFVKDLHLYESIGNSTYKKLWTHSFLPSFEEIEHTADIAFSIYGNDIFQLYQHALIALAFKYPKLLDHRKKEKIPTNLDDIVVLLNEIIGRTDHFVGCPFKAVSFHGKIYPFKQNKLQWEMIVDV